MPSKTDEAAPAQAEEDATERLARAHAALAAAQERSYWLDRWQIDLNSLMRRPGASQLRTGLRAARSLRNTLTTTKRRAVTKTQELRAAPLVGAHDDTVPIPASANRPEFTRSLSPRSVPSAPVTDLLFARLSDHDVKQTEAALAPEERALLAHAAEADRRRLLLSWGVHHRVPGVLERSGLTTATPPADVHAMGRGSAAAGGSAYYADLVVDALTTAGFELSDGMHALDFGCSSGRVVRALAAAYPGVAWSACDPIADAIEWATENLPGIEFRQNPERPPLEYEDHALDMVYAISIWSHFAEPAALAWLEEMHRLLRPGGMLVMSTHGLQSLAHDANGVRGPEQLGEVRDALYRHGFWFKDEFGEDRDHGVGDAAWGTSFLTTEWLAWNVAPAWKIGGFAPGRVEGNQDVYVLERR